MTKGSNVHMKENGYTWKDLDRSYWEGFDNAKNKMEKRIEELERKLEQTEKDLADYQFNYPTIKELKKENAELKKENEELPTIAFQQGAEWYKKKADIKLTKAKDILNEFMRISKASDEDFEHDYSELIREAEQFLKGENIILEDAQVGNSPFDADEVFNKEMKAYPEEKVK